jgi:uncharacterized protein
VNIVQIYFAELEFLKGKAKEIQFNFSFAEMVEENPEVIESSSVQFVGEARYVTGMVEVSGTCSLHAKFSCARCLNQFEKNLEIPFKELFAKTNATQEENKEANEEIHWIDDESFDLIPYCKEVIILALPFLPICKEECKGLCVVCGRNLNEHDCGCKVESIDPRLAALAKLLNQEEK